MSLKTLLRIVVTGVFMSLASADCALVNTAGSVQKQETDQKQCLNQGPGVWTFGMYLSGVCVPANGDGGLAGCANANYFSIFDEDCNIRGVYSPDGNNCGTPYTISDGFLDQEVIITDVDWNLGGGYFSFNYGNGKYSINNNNCGCEDDSSGATGIQVCKCAFPVNGTLPS